MTKVLFIDDDPEILAGLERAVRPWREDYDFAFICGGPAGLSVILRSRFDVIVTDMAMPILSGNELVKRAQRARPRAAYIVLSGRCDAAQIDALTQANVTYVSKPVTPETLVTLIDDALDWLSVSDHRFTSQNLYESFVEGESLAALSRNT